MGIVGLLWLLFAYFTRNKVKFFLKYNIIQSIVISVLLAIFNLTLDIILSLLAKIPLLDFVAAAINIILQFQIIKIFNLSLSIVGLFVFLVLTYIIIGIVLGRIFYVPYLSPIMQRTMKKYN